MELLKGPAPVAAGYRENVAHALGQGKVVATGWFDKVGIFGVLRGERRMDMHAPTQMWALNLLRYTEGEDGIWADREGFLHVFNGRIGRRRGEKFQTIHVIDPANVRFVGEESFEEKVGQSGWLFSDRAAWRQRYLDHNPLTKVGLEEILANAEAGIKPPFFDDHTDYIKVEPALSGKQVQVVRFDHGDAVVLDLETRQLVGRKVERLLSKEKWMGKE